jgi:hypothetical protein
MEKHSSSPPFSHPDSSRNGEQTAYGTDQDVRERPAKLPGF